MPELLVLIPRPCPACEGTARAGPVLCPRCVGQGQVEGRVPLAEALRSDPETRAAVVEIVAACLRENWDADP